jgi:glycerol kinase
VRAALEAMAYGTHDVLQAMVKDSGVQAQELGVDGGACQNDWLMQFQADILGLPVHRPANIESTAFGAAGLAGIGVGIWRDAEHFREARGTGKVFEPHMSEQQRTALLAGWQRAVRAALAWANA